MLYIKSWTTCTTQAENSEVFCEHFENLFDKQLQYYEDTASLIVQLSIQEVFAEEPDDEEVLEACQKRKKHQVTLVYCLNLKRPLN